MADPEQLEDGAQYEGPGGIIVTARGGKLYGPDGNLHIPAGDGSGAALAQAPPTLSGIGGQVKAGAVHDLGAGIAGTPRGIQDLLQEQVGTPNPQQPTGLTNENVLAQGVTGVPKFPTAQEVSKKIEPYISNPQPKSDLERLARWGGANAPAAVFSPEVAGVRSVSQMAPALLKSAVRNVAAPPAFAGTASMFGGTPATQATAATLAPMLFAKGASPFATTPEQAASSRGIEAAGMKLSPQAFKGPPPDPHIDNFNNAVIKKAFGDWDNSKVPGVTPLPGNTPRFKPLPYTGGQWPDVGGLVRNNIANEFNHAAASSPGLNFSAVVPRFKKIIDDYADGMPMDKAGRTELQDAAINLQQGLQPTGGVLTGKAYQSTRSQLGRDSKSTQPEMREAYHKMKDALDTEFEKTIPNPADRDVFRTARKHAMYESMFGDGVKGSDIHAASGQLTPETVLKSASDMGRNYHNDPVLELSRGAVTRTPSPAADKTAGVVHAAKTLALPLLAAAVGEHNVPEGASHLAHLLYGAGPMLGSIAAAKGFEKAGSVGSKMFNNIPGIKNQFYLPGTANSPFNLLPASQQMSQALAKGPKGKSDNSQ